MSLTRQPLQSSSRQPTTSPGTDSSWPGMLAAWGNQAVASMLSTGDLDASQPSFGGLGGSTGSTATTAAATTAATTAAESAQLPLALAEARPWRANSPLIDQLMKMDPEEAILAAGLDPESWMSAFSAMSPQSTRSWTEMEKKLGKEASDALMGAAADDLVSQHLNENGLTNLFVQMLDPRARQNPSTENIQKAMTDNFGDSVTKLINPTVAEAEAVFGTNKIQNAALAAHGLPRHIEMRVGDSNRYQFQDSEALATAVGESEELRSMLLVNCYGAMGGQGSTAGKIASEGVTTLGSHVILNGAEADQLARTAFGGLGKGLDPDSAFRAAGQEWLAEAQNRYVGITNGKLSNLSMVERYAEKGFDMHGADQALVKATLDQGHVNGRLPELSVFKGSRNDKPLPTVEEPTISPTLAEGGEQLALPGFDVAPTSPKVSAPAVETATSPTTGALQQPELPVAAPEPATGAYGLELEPTLAAAGKNASRLNLLESGLSALGVLGGGWQAAEGVQAIGAAAQGTGDQREGVVGGANLISGLSGILQGGVTLASKIPQLAPALEAAPWLKAVPGMKSLGMLAALPSVAGWGYDVASGKDGSVTSLSGGNALESLGNAALSTFGGGVGMAVSLGNSLGEGVFNTCVEHAENAPKSLGELGGMIDYSTRQVGLGNFMQDTIGEMAFDSRLEDPNASKQSKDWAYASASMARLYLMADQGVHDLFGSGDQSMLHQILKPEEQKTPSAALAGGD